MNIRNGMALLAERIAEWCLARSKKWLARHEFWMRVEAAISKRKGGLS